MTTEQNALQAAHQLKLQEVQAQQAKLAELQADLAKLNAKVANNEKLSAEDTEFVSKLGWLSALSVTIATVASSI